MNPILNLARFAMRWHQLAAGNHCDTWGGKESHRVYGEWVAAGSPETITEFILEAANRPPGSSAWPEHYNRKPAAREGVPDDAA